MKISIIALARADTEAVVQALSKVHTTAKLAVCAEDGNLIESLKGADIVINMLSASPWDSSVMKLTGVPEYEPSKALLTLQTIALLPVLKSIDTLAEAYKQIGASAPFINAGEGADIVTGYLAVKHGIISYGIAPKAANALRALIKATQLKYDAEKLRVKGAGLKDYLWLYEIKDSKGKDIYTEFRNATTKERLNVKRFDLSRDGLKSLRFFDFYHSANAESEETSSLLTRIVTALSSDKDVELWLLAVNKDYIQGLTTVPAELPCKVSSFKVTPQAVELPLQCVLAMNDYAGALSVSIKALAERSATLFKRMFKLEPYTASLLTLAEAEAAAEGVLTGNAAAKELLRREEK